MILWENQQSSHNTFLFCSSPVSGRCISLSSAGLGMYVEFNLLLTTMFSDV